MNGGNTDNDADSSHGSISGSSNTANNMIYKRRIYAVGSLISRSRAFKFSGRTNPGNSMDGKCPMCKRGQTNLIRHLGSCYIQFAKYRGRKLI